MSRSQGLRAGPGWRALALCTGVALAAAACRDATGPAAGAIGDVALGAGQFALYPGSATTSTLHFPAAGAAPVRYLVAAQFATGTADVSAAFALGDGAAAMAPAMLERSPVAYPASAAARFHDNLRRTEARLAAESGAAGVLPAPPPVARAAATVTPPVVGAKRTFRVCGDLDCGTLVNVLATAKYVGSHAALFLDDTVPTGGFTPGDLTQIGQQFDSDLYPVDHAAFGAESDVDSNGVVIILLTPKVNALVQRPECASSFVTGFFFGADLAPGVRTSYNNGEVFYGFVPDPAGTIACAQSAAQVRRLISVTFIHEFQHMISFNQHVLVRNGSTEVLWLNEALSHLAEELGGRHYDSLADTVTASSFFVGDLYNAGQYLASPTALAVVTEVSPGELAQRGAGWLFVRYLTDRFGPQTPHNLVSTGLRGSANVAQAAGTPFATLLGRWALALYTSDLPGFSPPPELRYETWHLRTSFASLHTQDPADFPSAFPLDPVAVSSSAVALSGSLRSGSASYLLVTQPASSGAFALTLRPSGASPFPALAGVQLAVVRLP